MQPQVIRIKQQQGTALCRWAEKQLRFNAIILGSLFSFVIRTVRTAVTLLLRTPPSTTETFIISWDEFLYSVLTEVRVLRYQPFCQNCFHLTNIFKFLAAKIHLDARSRLQEERSAVLSTQNYGLYKLNL
jgi:hypothetical protein